MIRNILRLHLPASRSRGIAKALRGPWMHWFSGTAMHGPAAGLSAHDRIRFSPSSAFMRRLRASFLEHGMPDYARLDMSEGAWASLQPDANFMRHPAIFQVPLSLPRLRPFSGPDEYFLFRDSPAAFYDAVIGLAIPPRSAQATIDIPDFREYPAERGNVTLTLDLTTAKSAPTDPLALLLPVLRAHDANAIWLHYSDQPSGGEWGAQSLLDDRLETKSWPCTDLPRRPDPEDPSRSVLLGSVLERELMEEGYPADFVFGMMD